MSYTVLKSLVVSPSRLSTKPGNFLWCTRFPAGDTFHRWEVRCRPVYHLRPCGSQRPWRTPADESRSSSRSAPASQQAKNSQFGSKWSTVTYLSILWQALWKQFLSPFVCYQTTVISWLIFYAFVLFKVLSFPYVLFKAVIMKSLKSHFRIWKLKRGSKHNPKSAVFQRRELSLIYCLQRFRFLHVTPTPTYKHTNLGAAARPPAGLPHITSHTAACIRASSPPSGKSRLAETRCPPTSSAKRLPSAVRLRTWWYVKGGAQGHGSVLLQGFFILSSAVLMYGITVLSTNAPKPFWRRNKWSRSKKKQKVWGKFITNSLRQLSLSKAFNPQTPQWVVLLSGCKSDYECTGQLPDVKLCEFTQGCIP